MLYYKALSEKFDYFSGNTTIVNELLTEKERYKKFAFLPDCCFDRVNVSPKKTYKSFGARFEIGTGANYDAGGHFIICDGCKLYTE